MGLLSPAHGCHRAVGDAVVAVEPLRHGLGNAATGGICRVRGTT